jgi:transcriptional regulator with XRE-family HTH domain
MGKETEGSGGARRRAREAKRLTRAAAATSLKISPESLRRYELPRGDKDAREPDAPTLLAMARLYGVSMEALMAITRTPTHGGSREPVSEGESRRYPVVPGTSIPDAFWAIERMQRALADISRDAGQMAREVAAAGPTSDRIGELGEGAFAGSAPPQQGRSA